MFILGVVGIKHGQELIFRLYRILETEVEGSKVLKGSTSNNYKLLKKT